MGGKKITSMRIGIDLGGTKIEAIALDHQGNTLVRHRIPTPADDYQGTLQAIRRLVEQIETELGARGTVGIGTPGAISPTTGLLKNANSVCLNGHPVDRDLAQALDRTVRMANDANCFALSEATDGTAAGAAIVFGVIIGTGTGGGVVINGRPLTGINAIAGEWGHNPLPWPRDEERPGPKCYCGKYGCIETFLSGPGLARDYSTTQDPRPTAMEIAQRAAAGESQARAALARYADRMARALANVINIVDPDVIVLGGGLSNIAQLYQDVPQLWSHYVFSDHVATRLTPPRFGDASGVRGAAWLWPE